MKYFIPKIDIECESFEETESSYGILPMIQILQMTS